MALTIASFVLFLLAFSTIGILSARHATGTSEDYLIAGRGVSPWLAALSSVATNNSGFMFVGLLGFTYRFGVQAVWLQLGWVLGDLIVWIWVHRRVREVSGELGVASVPTLLGTDPTTGRRADPMIVAAGLLTFFFLGGYAAAQLKAGATALETLFGWEPWAGAVLGAVIVVAYCFSGGIRASIWTDAAQAFVMLFSMTVLVAWSAAHVGGPSDLFAKLAAVDPALVRWIPDDLALGFGLYGLGFVFGGLGAIGQPHILVRSMAIRSPDDIPHARKVYFAWFVPFNIVAIAAGMYARVLLPDLLAGAAPGETVHAAELALPSLAVHVLPDVLVGLILAGLFSATMSTADSQVLSCSAAVTQDIAPRWRRSYTASKAATLAVTALALLLAVSAREGVFALVLVAWSALGAGLGPILVLRLYGRPVTSAQGLVMMATGVATVFAWGASDLSDDVFKLLPGITVPFIVYLITQPWLGARDQSPEGVWIPRR